MSRGFIYTNENCISCSKCVRICTAVGASRSQMLGDNLVIGIDQDRCINCGACFEACDRNARAYHDDTDLFFSDLKNGEEVSVLVAPAFAAKYPERWKRILGGLKKLGVKRIIPVAFGADICTWAYLKLFERDQDKNYISSTCPVVTAFLEHCMPQLLPWLMPVVSPMMCAATYCREELGMTERFAFLGPCIAKKMEMDRRPDLVQYNVTFDHLIPYCDEHGIDAEPAEPSLPFGLGTFYPAPGGLADNIRWFLGDDVPIRTISGKRYLFRWLRNSQDLFTDKKITYQLIDALNCQEGCIEGTAGRSSEAESDNSSLFELHTIRRKVKSEAAESPWNPGLPPDERLRLFNRQFEALSLDHYLREYEDESYLHKTKLPSETESNDIYLSMYKVTEAQRNINCSACGYPTCEDMVNAIYNGLNVKNNCIYFEREEAIRNEHKSYFDSLTGVLNRNAFEEHGKHKFITGRPLAVVAADVNGLKYANDNLGHAAGDRLIQNCAALMSAVFGENHVYRTGGDEFVALLSDTDEREFSHGVEQMKQTMSGADYSMALGYHYTDEFNGDLKSVLESADNMMYRDKEEYYARTGALRRS